MGFPEKNGLYDPAFEHDACGVGFVVNYKGEKSHDIIQKALSTLCCLTHRGAVGADAATGDGAGILMQSPDAFLRKVAAKEGIALPAEGDYAVGMVMLPGKTDQRRQCIGVVEEVIEAEGQTLLGWREVPTDNRCIGEQARDVEPHMAMVFVGKNGSGLDQDAFDRKLFVIRKVIERTVRESGLEDYTHFHIASLSSRKLIFKGQLLAHQIEPYFPDLSDPDLVSAMALVHQRFSTNTFPTWDLAQPFRYLAHNGEINTLKGNKNWIAAREAAMQSDLLGEDLKKVFPVIPPGGSDSADLDCALELLVMAGYSLPHALMMLIPEAWTGDPDMDPGRKAFYEFQACRQEPWDGPAGICFSDGRLIGATLDRNGLRPLRYYITKNGLVVLASEAGVIEFPPEEIQAKGRLAPGRMLVVDTEKHQILFDADVKQSVASQKPYAQWVADNIVDMEDLPEAPKAAQPKHGTILERQRAFGYTLEDLRFLLAPMATNGEEPIGSMGNDTPLAAMSDRPQVLYNYFKQLFAQVTNPPIDAIREEMVMTHVNYLGGEGNLLQELPADARLIRLKSPILRNQELEQLRHNLKKEFRAITLSTLVDAEKGEAAMAEKLAEICAQADQAIADGYAVIILSDRGVSPRQMPIPALLFTSAVHHHLIRQGTRTRAGLVVETGEAREVSHFALLLGYGATAVNPYLAFETLKDMVNEGLIAGKTPEDAVKNYVKAIHKGLFKIFSKMGISTLQSYQGAQIFEAIGIHPDVISKYFTGTPSRIGGVNLAVIAQEVKLRHEAAFGGEVANLSGLDLGGHYQFRRGAEFHMINPPMVQTLQKAVRENDLKSFREYCDHVDNNPEKATLRHLFDFAWAAEPLPLEEVEPTSEIVKRFATGAMSYGSISQEAHETLAIAMNRIGGWSNTGEGGEDPVRYQLLPNGDSKNSKIKQVASGRFGVTSYYLSQAQELQIKIAQGAKPGEGGQLPGHKVSEEIAKTRYRMPGVTLISPPPHHDIYSIEDLAQLIFDLKNSNPQARVSVKLVADVGVGTIAAGVAKAKADVILISGDSGGTGASPLSSIKHAGIAWEIGLAETQQVLVMNDLRGRVRVQTDGQIKTARGVVVAALLGADEIGFATVPLIALGCIMMRKCHLNTCPVGIATQDPALRAKFMGQPEHVVNFFFFLAEEIRQYMARLGFRAFDEMVGRVDKLHTQTAITHWKQKGLDFSNILKVIHAPKKYARLNVTVQYHALEDQLDNELIRLCAPALENRQPVKLSLPIRNIHRTVGATLSFEVSKKYALEGLAPNTIHITFTGSAGQSFGAFLARGITMELIGDANDYTGKGLSGGVLVVRPHEKSTFKAEENSIVGNVVLYGATGGQAFFRGVAGERFCVRNSGALAVTEGVGDHGCEYMTGGRVVVLGPTGRNFAAGMSGGVAYVLDAEGQFSHRCNPGMVGLEPLTDATEIEEVRELIQKHHHHTGSTVAEACLENWDDTVKKLVKVLPNEYKAVLEKLARQQKTAAS